jgi:hypothetical protein
MTLLQLEDDALEALGYNTATVDSSVRTRIRRFINRWQHQILTRPGFTRLLRDGQTTFTTTASQAVYGMPDAIGRIDGITCPSQDMVLAQRDLSWLRRVDPGLKAIGGPAEAYIPIGHSAVLRQPAVAGNALYVVSSSAADTTQTVTVRSVGIEGSEYLGSVITTTVTLNGTTPVQVTTFGISEVASGGFVLNTTAAGVVSLTDVSGGPTLSKIFPGKLFARYFQFRLWPTPTAALTYTVDYTRSVDNILANNQDVPLLPEEFHYLLSLGAQVDEWRRKDDTRMDDVQEQLEQGLRNLNKWLWDTTDYLTTYDTRPWARRSRLGGWFPAGT